MTHAIEMIDVVKRYGDFEAVAGVDLRVPPGATYGLLGPNGAGKTTAIRMILAIIEPTVGEIRVLGEPVSRDILDRVGYLPEERGVYKKMTVRRLLRFLAELKGVRPRESAPRIDRWLERFELEDWRDARLEELSKGMQQKIQFITTVLHDPEIVILDEPFSGLDPINQRVLREIIGDLKREGKTILFSTHIIEHAERMCDHVCIIARGRKLVDGPLQQVKTDHAERYVSLATADGSDARAILAASTAVATVRDPAGPGEAGRGVHSVSLRPGVDPNDLLEELVARRVALRRFELVEPTLEQVFIERVGRDPAPEERLAEREVVHV
ncbi:MAG TPA: ATP-binding cassette domain-containing protein [Longimicrobiales bacterium]|nr:ATP-binding cassette domain-containing protein [Longimicrobiales bacterium]